MDPGRQRQHRESEKRGIGMEQSKTILHVDDDPDQLRVVSTILKQYGYAVEPISDPDEALVRLSETGIRLVLLDIDMPGKDGLTVLREIKQVDGGVQVIMLTGMVKMSTVLRSMRWGAEACIFKPITDPAPLVEAIEAAFAKIDRWWYAVGELAKEKKKLPPAQPVSSATD